MAAGDITNTGGPVQIGGGLWLLEGTLEADAGGTECKIGGLILREVQLTCEDATETAPAVYVNFSDGGVTAANGSAFVRHSGSGTDKFHFRATLLM
jgi:hypothetical protein